MTAANWSWAWDVIYSPFGAVSYIWTNPEVMDARFPGQWFQLETGLAYNRNRDYDPTLGRYIQPDPKGLTALLSDGPSAYNYAGQSPLVNVDPTGLQEILLGRLPPWLDALIKNGDIPPEALNQPKDVIPRQSGKDASSDAPNWCRGERPMIRENGRDFAKRLLDEKYGPGNYKTDGPDTEFSQIKKWGDRNFEIPRQFLTKYKF